MFRSMAHQVTDMGVSYSHDAIDRCDDLCITKVHLGLSYRGSEAEHLPSLMTQLVCGIPFLSAETFSWKSSTRASRLHQP